MQIGLNGVWRGWHWQIISLMVVGLGALQTVAAIWLHYPVTTSMPMAMLIVIYLVVPRTKERQLANTLAAVVAMFLVNLLLEFSLPSPTVKVGWIALLEMNLWMLIMGLLMAFLYLRVMRWSERKRVQMEDRRRSRETPAKADRPTVNVRRHRWKKKPKKHR